MRAIDVVASPALLWRWLCQLRVAPYSYDWIDNLGVRSPQQLTPGLDELEVGQVMLRVFHIASFARDQQVTIVARSRFTRLPPYAMSYVVTPRGLSASRLVVHIRFSAPRGIPKGVKRVLLTALSAVDAMMMSHQLRNLKALAERDARLQDTPS